VLLSTSKYVVLYYIGHLNLFLFYHDIFLSLVLFTVDSILNGVVGHYKIILCILGCFSGNIE
jgi:hypothetical protein